MSRKYLATHLPCPSCESSDALCVYAAGDGLCFSCGKWFKEGEIDVNQLPKNRNGHSKARKKPMQQLEKTDWGKSDFRGLSKQTLDAYGITRLSDGRILYEYRDTAGNIVAQKIRDENKAHSWSGDHASIAGFGAHLANPDRHDSIAITEGELDAPSITQSSNGKVIGVSVPDGAQSAAAFVKKHLNFFGLFKNVFVATDMDSPGQQAAEALVPLFEAGKVRRVQFTSKDANEELNSRGSRSVMDAIMAAKILRPDGIKSASSYAGLTLKPHARKATRCAFNYWNDKTPFYTNQLITLIAGSGVGKSTFARALAIGDLERGIKVGWIGLEETAREAIYRFAGMAAGVQIHARESYAGLTDEQMADIAAADKFITGSGNLELFDHFGSVDTDTILNRMSYMVRSLGVQHIYLDHLTIVGSGLCQDTRQMDAMITKLRTFISATECTVFAISHLNRSSSQSQNMENGGKPELHDIRGSHSVCQLSDTIWALSRKRGENTTDSYCLKNRVLGRCGYAGSFQFDETTQQFNQIWAEPGGSF